MELYVLKSVSCLAIFFAFYKIFLERANMHKLKRFYLVGASIAAILIPIITFTSYVEIPSEVPVMSSEAMLYITSAEVQKAPNYLAIIGWCIYGLGVLFFSVKFGRNLFRMIDKIRKNPHFRDKNIFHVLLNTEVIPHTFFSYIFLNKKKFEASEIPEEVLLHERTHAVEKHSLDILLMEFLQIIFWFNPFIYFIKNSVKLNHEFLADRAVIKNGAETSAYQNILLAFSSNAQSPQLANSINYSSTRLNELFSKNPFGLVKKRFTVMKTHTSKRGFWFRSLLLLPLLAILIYGFSTTEIIEKESAATSEVIKKEATPQEVAEYNQLAAHWNEQFAKVNAKRIIQLEDLNTLETLYRKLSTTQKGKAQPFPDCIPPPPPPIPANATEKQKQEYLATIYLYEQKYGSKVHEIMLGDNKTGLVNFIVDYEKYDKEDAVKATPKQIAEYNKLARKYNAMDPDNMVIKKKDMTRMKYLYDLMTKEQRQNAEPFPNIPPPPPPPAPEAPPAPEVIKGVNDGDPNVPPPPPPPAPHFKIKKGSKFMLEGKSISYEKAIKLIKDKNYQIQVLDYDSDTPTVKISTEPFVVKKGSKSNIPPPPPMDPMDHIKKMADEGATFFYEDKEVTYNYVIDLVLFNKNLNIQTKTFKSTPPIVYISRDFIFVKGNN